MYDDFSQSYMNDHIIIYISAISPFETMTDASQ